MLRKQNEPESRGKRLSLYGVDPDDALRAFMQVDPARMKAKEKTASKREKKKPAIQ